MILFLPLSSSSARSFFPSSSSPSPSLSSCLPVSVHANPNELTNGVINAAFMLLFKDSIRLFAAYNEGVINLLGKDRSRIIFNHSFLLSKGIRIINSIRLQADFY